MKSTWTQHVKNEEDKKALELAIRNSRVAIDTLRLIVEKKKTKFKLDDYSCPSWPYMRADKDGYNRALNEILSILDIDPPKEKQ